MLWSALLGSVTGEYCMSPPKEMESNSHMRGKFLGKFVGGWLRPWVQVTG